MKSKMAKVYKTPTVEYNFWQTEETINPATGKAWSFEYPYSVSKCRTASQARWWALSVLWMNPSVKALSFKRVGGWKVYREAGLVRHQ